MITGFFKLVFGLIRLAFFLAILALIFHTWAIKQALKLSLGWSLGAGVAIESVKMDWKNTGFEVRGLEIGNPNRFPQGLLADVPLVIVSVDLPGLSHGMLHLKAVGINIKELRVTHIPGLGLNVMELKPLQKEEVRGERSRSTGAVKRKIREHMPRIMIDELILSLGDLSFVETLGTMEKQKRIRLGIQGATYYDLKGTGDIAYIVVSLALKRLGYSLLGEPFQQFGIGSASGIGSKSFWGRLKKALTE